MSQKSDYGKLYRIIPKTTFEESNKRTCYQYDAQIQGNNEEETSDNDKDTNVDDDTNNDSSTDQENSEIVESSGDDEILQSQTDTTTTEKFEDTNEHEKGARKPRADNNENKNDNTRIKPQTVLPDCTNFKYIGKSVPRSVLIAQ